MKTNIMKKGTVLTVAVEGSIDTVTAPTLEKELKAQWDDVTELVLDFSDVSFLSSAGIRVILTAHKWMVGQGRLVLRNVKDEIQDVFNLTGLGSVLNFE